MKSSLVVLSLAVLTVLVALSMQAQVPHVFSYQGVLTDTLGVPKPDGSYSVTFRLYDVESGGSALWTEAKTLDVKRGLFSTVLGDQVVIGPSIKFDRAYWLGIQVSAQPELSPRVPWTPVAYSVTSESAMHAQVADTALVSVATLGNSISKGSIQVDSLLSVGTPSNDGQINVYQNGAANPVVVGGNWLGRGGMIDYFDNDGNKLGGFEADYDGTGGYFGVASDSNGWPRGVYIDGNRYGTEQPYVHITGTWKSAAFDMSTTADACVQLPDSSVSSVEMLDEPGIAVKFGPDFFKLANTASVNQLIDSITIDVPAPGKVIVDAVGYALVDHVNGTSDNFAVHVLGDPTADVFVSGVSNFYIPAALPSNTWYRYPFACKNIFNADSPTSMKIYLVAYQASGGNIGNSYVAYSAVQATYYPTTYGVTPLAVAQFAASSDGSAPAGGITSSQVMYQSAEEFNSLKTRQLKAELDELKAKIESLEKQISAANGSLQRESR